MPTVAYGAYITLCNGAATGAVKTTAPTAQNTAAATAAATGAAKGAANGMMGVPAGGILAAAVGAVLYV
jgi:hypothetical protein